MMFSRLKAIWIQACSSLCRKLLPWRFRPDEWYAGLNEVYSRRRRYVEEIMNELGCSFNPSQSGLFLWGKFPAVYRCRRADGGTVHRNHLFVTPGSVFGDNGRST
jgi:LL-diaminopimelate aminotransferase